MDEEERKKRFEDALAGNSWQSANSKYLTESGQEKSKDLSPLVRSISTQVAQSRVNDETLDSPFRNSAETYVKQQTPQEFEAKKRALQALANQVPKKKSIAATIKDTNLMGNLNVVMKKKEKR